jgi:hypothetical protein
LIRLLKKEVGNMRGATSMLNIKAQLLIAAILVSATCTVSAQTADQTSPPATAAATEIAVPRADTVKKPDARKATVDHTSAAAAAAATEIAVPKADAVKKADARKPNVETADQTTPPAVVAATETPAPRADVRKPDAKKPQSWHCGWFPWACSSGRVGLILGTAY